MINITRQFGPDLLIKKKFRYRIESKLYEIGFSKITPKFV
jgi:hypothetical protein